MYRRATIVSTLLFACAFGAAFGALQVVPQIVPGLVPSVAVVPKLQEQLQKLDPASAEYKSLKTQIVKLTKEKQQIVGNVQLYQELGGLVGRFALAWLALVIASRVKLLRLFQIPGLLIIPAVFFLAAAGNLGGQSLEVLKWGIAVAGFCTILAIQLLGQLPAASLSDLFARHGGKLRGQRRRPNVRHGRSAGDGLAGSPARGRTEHHRPDWFGLCRGRRGAVGLCHWTHRQLLAP